ncbi:hypothetical protein [Bradyrhizobium ottawaense]|uniref:hypothetical protein n=1 Tax=Bradyrhizobium ottawaense TaxID=931866 RepID=UPI001BA9F25F|nr:hypothetical protein [Bradyrhizobium ottawaense]MBR1335192.1 hypothetical protein [Bradyrhizobium ottawaense]
MDLTVATWFIADTPETATAFPQVGVNSATPEFQKVYWRSIVGFYATSKAQNPTASHVFFSNCAPPVIDGLDVADYLASLQVETITLDITYRLPRTVAKDWGNQFYILDIVKFAAERMQTNSIIVLDSDCVWNRSADKMRLAIERYGCLTYVLGLDAYAQAERINGVTRQEMKEALLGWKPNAQENKPNFGLEYCGGEIFAATQNECKRLASILDDLWLYGKGFREEAHFLSILYATLGYAMGTADPFIKRMWTTFKHNNIHSGDTELTVWHLPAEKKSGFLELFEGLRDGKLSPADLTGSLGSIMGIPRRGVRKFARDFANKVVEHAGW